MLSIFERAILWLVLLNDCWSDRFNRCLNKFWVNMPPICDSRFRWATQHYNIYNLQRQTAKCSLTLSALMITLCRMQKGCFTNKGGKLVRIRRLNCSQITLHSQASMIFSSAIKLHIGLKCHDIKILTCYVNRCDRSVTCAKICVSGRRQFVVQYSLTKCGPRNYEYLIIQATSSPWYDSMGESAWRRTTAFKGSWSVRM